MNLALRWSSQGISHLERFTWSSHDSTCVLSSFSFLSSTMSLGPKSANGRFWGARGVQCAHHRRVASGSGSGSHATTSMSAALDLESSNRPVREHDLSLRRRFFADTPSSRSQGPPVVVAMIGAPSLSTSHSLSRSLAMRTFATTTRSTSTAHEHASHSRTKTE